MIVIEPGDQLLVVADGDDPEALGQAAEAMRKAFPDVEVFIVARTWMVGSLDSERFDRIREGLGQSASETLMLVLDAGMQAYEPSANRIDAVGEVEL